MTDNSLRTAIEQALFTAIQDQPRGVGGQVVSFYGFEDMPPRMRKTIRDEADAVLAVLADPPFEVWERCVNRIEVDDMDQRHRETIVNTVLRALLEKGEDDD